MIKYKKKLQNNRLYNNLHLKIMIKTETNNNL